MSFPLLAIGQSTHAPYTFKRLLLKVYSIEELCYLFKTNPFIIDVSIIDRKLVTWIETSCALPDLARSLQIIIKKNKGPFEFVKTILEYTGYLNENESAHITEIFSGNIGLSDYEKEINRADFLLKCEKYQLALHDYDRILLSVPAGERLISGRIYHNRGVSLARLFLFEQAAESFLKAYKLNNRPESGRAYLASIRLNMNEIDYVSFIADNPSFYDFSLEVEHVYNQALSIYNETDEKMKLDDLILDKAMGNGNAYYAGTELLISEAKKHYRSLVEI